MKQNKGKVLSVSAFIVNLIPFSALIPAILQITVSNTVRHLWAILNILLVAIGAILSLRCILNKDKRNIYAVTSTILTGIWLTLIIGTLTLAMFINLTQR